MKPLGVFDIGSNTILLTAGRKVRPEEIEILLDVGDVARLSEGLREGGALQEAAKARALATLKQLQKLGREKGVENWLAAGTSAFRRASDGTAFAAEIQKILGIPVRILSGDEEAAYSYASARQDFGADAEPLGMIDIGGGSTEWVFSGSGPCFSFPIGTVRLTESLVTGHPIPDPEWKRVRETIFDILKEAIPTLPSIPRKWVAVAATPASLAAVLLKLPSYDPQKVHGFLLAREELAKLVETLRTHSIQERNRMPGMDPKRSELLPVGGEILQTCMEYLNLDSIVVSDHGLRYGILYEALLAQRK